MGGGGGGSTSNNIDIYLRLRPTERQSENVEIDDTENTVHSSA